MESDGILKSIAKTIKLEIFEENEVIFLDGDLGKTYLLKRL